MSDQSTPRGSDGETSGADGEQASARQDTGIIDVTSTQALPAAGAPAPASVAAPAARSADEPASTTWFDTVVPGHPQQTEHPVDGPGVPARADSPWGSDRADAQAEAAHLAAHRAAHEAAQPQDAPELYRYAPPGTGFVDEAGVTTLPEGPVGAGPGGPAGSVGPTGSASAAARPRGGRFVAGVAALALACGLAGGVAGQFLTERVQTGAATIPEPGPGATSRPAGSVANIAATAVPSVVTIKVRGDKGSGTGSGFVIDSLGHILTNNHVIGGAASGGDIEVMLSNGQTQKATIVGRDVSYDLAVLKMDRKDIKPLAFGASGGVVVGDQVIAVGAPLGLEQTVTTGIVSALNRPVTPGGGDEASYINAIQTDAAINPGNSGGPLLDMTGKVIGVNSAIARVPGTSGGTGGNIGLGFAIPSDQARRTANQLITTGKATHPIIGVMLDRTYSGEGAGVLDQTNAVTAGSPAAKAGIKPGDVIVGFEGNLVRTPDQLIVSIRARGVGETVTLKIKRGAQELDLKMTLEAAPDN